MGGGTNLLVNDKGYEGLVLKIKTAKYKITNKTITTEAGVSLAEIVGASLKAGLTGLDWAVGIPGTLGGAVYGNCGAFGSSISKTIKNIVALNTENLKIKNIPTNNANSVIAAVSLKRTRILFFQWNCGWKKINLK